MTESPRMPLRKLVASCAFLLGVLRLLAADSTAIKFDLPADTADRALKRFSEQANVDVLVDQKIAHEVRTRAVTGEMSPRQAIGAMLADSGLIVFHDSRSGAFTVRRETPAEAKNVVRAIAQTETSDRPSKSSVHDEKQDMQEALTLDAFTVTGTRIRGGQPTSPVVTITQEEMRLSGYVNLGEAIRALPQNFSGGQNPGVAVGATTSASNANTNLTGGSSLNLRGLGPDATLTLLNGSRLTYDGARQAVDVSAIPIAAIERVEILLDGASAIYGSDAVGGVANILLKRDYIGAELSARFGAATDGGFEQEQYSAVTGTRWGSGGVLVTGNYSSVGSVRARQRDYLGQLANQNVTIYPQQTQKNALLSGHQRIGSVGELRLDLFYNTRTQENIEQTGASSYRVADLDSSLWGASPSLRISLPGDWSARPYGSFGRNDGSRVTVSVNPSTGAETGRSLSEYAGGMQAGGIELEGPIFALPGGDVRTSLGGGYRRNTLDLKTVNLLTNAVSGVLAAHDSSGNLFGEINLPLISEFQHVPMIRRLSLNLAIRHEDYKSFGSSTTPKIGTLWGVIPGLDVKASWGKSFKVPTLVEQYSDTFLALYPGEYFGGATGSQVLALFGSDPKLTPEKAEVVTAGLVAQPKSISGLRLELSYFDIDYTDRVSTPVDNLFAALTNPVYAEFVSRSPSVDLQNAAFSAVGQPVGTFLPGFNAVGGPYDATRVIAIINGRLANAADHRISGIDLNARYSTSLFGGDVTFTANGNWITKGTRRPTPLTADQPAAGVNFWPAKFKGRLGAAWSKSGLTLNTSITTIAGIVDRSVTPNLKRSSMTTADLVVDYQAKLPVVGDIGLNLAVSNLLNQAPPYLQPPSLPDYLVNFDSTNYSALGRVVSASITKRF